MNYYNPSFYPSYNGNIQIPPSQYYFNQQPQQVMNNPSANGLNGKLVDSEDMARVTEVPIGGYGIFPKADLSEVYIKSWNQNGTTSITTFKPCFSQQQQKEENSLNTDMNTIIEKINLLENKLDAVLASKSQTQIEVKKAEPARKDSNNASKY